MLDLAQLRKVTILVVGDIILDGFYHGKVTRFTPDAPVPVIKVHNITRRLGGAANVANNLSSLGVNTILTGFVGRDDSCKYLKELLVKHTIQHYLIETEHPTITKMNVIGENIDGERQKMFRMDFEETVEESEYSNFVLDTLRNFIDRTHAIVISDYLKGVCTPKVCQEIMRIGKTHNVPVIVDPKGKDWQKGM